jgi:hypothetical protein
VAGEFDDRRRSKRRTFDIRGSSFAEVAIERVGDRGRVAPTHEEGGEVGPSDDTGTSLGRELVGIERHSQPAKAIEQLAVAPLAVGTRVAEQSVDGTISTNEVREKVHRATVVGTGDLTSTDELQPEIVRPPTGFTETAQGIVIGQRDGRTPRGRRELHDPFGRLRTVRARRVEMKIDHTTERLRAENWRAFDGPIGPSNETAKETVPEVRAALSEWDR